MNYSAELCEMYANPDRDEHEFWSLVKRYVGRCANGQVLNHQIDELTADVLYQIVLGLPRFKPVKGASSFSRWIAGIVKRRGADMRRGVATSREISPTSLAEESRSGERIEADVTQYAAEMSQEHFDDLIYQEQPSPAVSDWLSKFRSELRPLAQRVFDGYLEGKSVGVIAAELGLTESSIRAYRVRWQRSVAGQSFPLAA